MDYEQFKYFTTSAALRWLYVSMQMSHFRNIINSSLYSHSVRHQIDYQNSVRGRRRGKDSFFYALITHSVWGLKKKKHREQNSLEAHKKRTLLVISPIFAKEANPSPKCFCLMRMDATTPHDLAKFLIVQMWPLPALGPNAVLLSGCLGASFASSRVKQLQWPFFMPVWGCGLVKSSGNLMPPL